MVLNSLVRGIGCIHLSRRELFNFTSGPPSTVVRKRINLEAHYTSNMTSLFVLQFRNAFEHSWISLYTLVKLWTLTSQRLEVRQQGMFSKGAEISTFRLPGGSHSTVI